MTGTHGIAITRMANGIGGDDDGRASVLDRRRPCLVHNGSLSNHNNVRRELVREGMKFETENDTESRGCLSLLADGAWQESRRSAGRHPLRPRRLLHLRRRHQERLRRRARSDRLQARVMAETDQYVAFGSEYRALTKLPGIDNARVWEPSPQPSISGSIEFMRQPPRQRATKATRASSTLDVMSLRELNQALHNLTPGSNETAWEVLNPKGNHSVAVGVDQPVAIDVRGSVGYYCAA